MRDLFFKLFESSHFNTGITVEAFSTAHIVYLVIIFGSIIGGYFLLRNKPLEGKVKAVRFLAYALMFSYLSDFFVHEFVYEGLKTDKLPFHICTFLGVLAAFSQFNRNGHKVREPIAILAILTPMMYLCFGLGNYDRFFGSYNTAYQKCLEMRGAISNSHSLGKDRKPYLRPQLVLPRRRRLLYRRGRAGHLTEMDFDGNQPRRLLLGGLRLLRCDPFGKSS